MDAEASSTRVPVMLDLTGWRCLVVGGGPVGARRAARLVEAGAEVSVVAPVMGAAVEDLAVTRIARAFADGDLDGVRLVVVATDDDVVNARVAETAAAGGVLVNRADGGGAGGDAAGELSFMAARRDGPLTVAVDSGGASAAAAKTLVQTAAEAIGPDWPVLLEEARRRRPALRGQPEKLRRLTDAVARDILKRCGRDALAEHLDAVVAEAKAEPGTTGP